MAKQKTLATTNPRYSYRTPKEEKAQVEKQIKALVAKVNSQKDQDGEDFYHIDQNTVFLEAVYRGLQYLERANLTPDHDEGYFQIKFTEKNRKCVSCKTVAVTPKDRKYETCGEKYTKKEFKELKVSK